ncbi:MAG TPA: ribonuclease HI family protein [Bacillota bacterium]|nr:ribonuclease HI family protein [Bacillota bacterium]HSX36553.1 ribonuclease HI family protein [Patescibacteria group bacterium]
MKSLKLEHSVAQRVQRGDITSTWRLYDDKDLSVNDQVALIDKVDPKNPATWKLVGIAHIDTVVQKRIRDLEEADYAAAELGGKMDNILASLRQYYGPQVDLSTPVKIIRYTINNNHQNQDNIVVEGSTLMKEVNLYADGGSRGNPGPSASGFVITDMAGRVVVKKGIYLGVTTNNQAEYQALKLGLEEAARMQTREVHVYMDSLLVVNQMLGIFKVKNRDLWPIHATIQELAAKFKHISYTHVPRELNKAADAAVNEALDEAERRA